MTIDPENKQSEKREYISRFKILSVLGEGGMGKVYKAHDPSLNKVFALKVLNSGYIDDQHHIRFQQEAKTLKDLKHEAIPEVYNFAVSREGDPYLVMEYIEGQSLRNLLDSDAELNHEQINDIIIQICEALNYAHNNGIVHRDIKPDNIVITDDETGKKTVKLIDFGISKLEDTIRQGQDMTQTGVIVGSPPYINPEQIRGESATIQSDIYSLGCVFFELLANKPPFIGKNALNTLSMHLEVPVAEILPELPDNLPERTVEIVGKCLEKNKEDRFQSAKELNTALLESITSNLSKSEGQIKIEVKEFESSSTKSLLIPIVLGVLVIGLIALATPYILKFVDTNIDLEFDADRKSTKRPESHNIFISDLVSGKQAPREWKFVKMVGKGYWRGGEEIEDSDFAKLRDVDLGKDAQIRVDFSDKITGSGIKYLKGLPVQALIIASKGLSDDYLKNLQLIPSLGAVAAGQAEHITINGFKELKHARGLIGIALKNLTLPDSGLEELKYLKKLRRLRLDGSKNVTRAQLESTLKYPALYQLVLDGSDVNLPDLNVLKKSKSLKVLSLRSLNITDEKVKYLVTIPVEKLDLSGNKITDKGLLELARNNSLREIVISDYKTSSKTKKLFKAINPNCKLNFSIVRPNPHEV